MPLKTALVLSGGGQTALVLSGGGMFGAWQAGVFSALEDCLRPDLVVGASVGSLNGYAIAAGWTAAELSAFWRQPEAGSFERLPHNIQTLMARHPLQIPYAVVLVDLLRMQPVTFLGPDITWEHLAASCAVPGMLPPRRIGGRWYVDGGLLNPLPVWAAVDLGAARVIALNALPTVPSRWLRPLVKGFRALFGHHPPLPSGVSLTTLAPRTQLGSMHDALHWKRENIERWLAQGAAEAAAAFAAQKTAAQETAAQGTAPKKHFPSEMS